MQTTIETTIATFNKVNGEAKLQFGSLTGAQLNWKPSSDKWSIAQCLDHLMVSNNTYLPQLDAVIAGKHSNSFYQNIRFISKFFGEYLIRETGPVVAKPMKNPPAFAPSQSEITGTIVSDFEKHQQQFSAKLSQLSATDLDKTVLSSPALGIITYTLRDLLTILSGHEQRHLNQAKNVLNHPNFPN
ncbi:MAG TPA: DinB family protein [Chitinophagales bacterium]|nr:DinB family protein [Chitinophagales bacterium]